MSKPVKMHSIGFVAARTGLAVSAIRFYEEAELVFPQRNSAGQRRFHSSDIRRLSFVMAAQNLGFTLAQIKAELSRLPGNRTPTKTDWAKISKAFGKIIDARINDLTVLRDRLDGCIGCGCLSLKSCALYNTGDRAGEMGAGPRYLLGDTPVKLAPQ